MHPLDVKTALDSMVCLVDTREQDTPRFRARMRDIGIPYERKKLNFGDYSARCDALDLTNIVTIERKMSLDEICACYCKERGRFEREFERAKSANGKIYLLIENGTWEKVYAGSYRSKMSPQALLASILAWLARYDCQLLFCKPETSARLIHDILYRELKERLEMMPDEPNGRQNQGTCLNG